MEYREHKILVVDDNEQDIKSIEESLRALNYSSISARDCLKAMDLVYTEKPDIIITDQGMSEKDGISILKEVKERYPNILVILLTAYGSYNSVLSALRAGASDYLEKPFTHEKLKIALQKAVNQSKLNENDTHKLNGNGGNGGNCVKARPQRPRKSPVFENMIGESDSFNKLLDKVEKAAKFNSHVMIYGESGTGKELIAQSIHALSTVAHKKFIPVDCVALPENLMESELFGYEKGAFTGATGMRRGLLEYAHEGTLFLDEICELDINLQAKLLRVLQQKEFRRVGGKELIKIDTRIISATNKNPEEAVEEGVLREDLYYRLNVIPLTVPALRERKEDVPLLVDYFLKKYCTKNGVPQKVVEPEVMNALMLYSWPGNVRELQNLVERLVSMVEGDRITEWDLPEDISAPRLDSHTHHINITNDLTNLPYPEAKKQGIQEIEKEYFETLLKRCEGNISQAAKLAHVSRPTIYRMIKTYDLFSIV